MDPDAEFVARVQAGDTDAFEQLVRRHFRRIFGTLSGILGNTDAARDATHPNAPVWPFIILALAGIGMLIYCAMRGGGVCRALTQILFILLLSGRNSSREGGSSWSGGGGSFGGGGASGRW